MLTKFCLQEIKMITDAAKALGIDLSLIQTNIGETPTLGIFELKSRTARKENISNVSSTEEVLMIKSEMPEELNDTENNFSSNVREPGEVFANEYQDFNESDFDMPEIPMISNAEIRAEMKIQSPEDPSHCSYECKFCKKVFANITHLKRHLPSHTGEKPFHCELCGLKFSRKDNLLIHKRTRCLVLRTAYEGSDIVHEDDITCIECGKKFISGNDYKRHMMTHTGLKPYNCEVCGKGFIQKSRFKTHVESHNSN